MIFLDTSFIIASKIEDDGNHEKSMEILTEVAQGKISNPVISDYIFDETMTIMLHKTKNLSLAQDLGTILKSAVNIIKVDEKIFESSWNIFKDQKGTHFSFTDCTILALMKEKGIKDIATFDKEFKKIKEINVIE